MIQFKNFSSKKITTIIIIILYFIVSISFNLIPILYNNNITKKILEYNNEDIYSSSEIADLIDLVLKIKYDSKGSKFDQTRPTIFLTKNGKVESYIANEELKNFKQDIITKKDKYIIVSMSTFVNSEDLPYISAIYILESPDIEKKENKDNKNLIDNNESIKKSENNIKNTASNKDDDDEKEYTSNIDENDFGKKKSSENDKFDLKTYSEIEEEDLDKVKFNSKFAAYLGVQNGNKIFGLFSLLRANYSINENNDEYLPYIAYISEEFDFENDDLVLLQNKDEIKELENELDTLNKYYVYIKENSETKIIKGILISSIELENGEEIAEQIANYEE